MYFLDTNIFLHNLSWVDSQDQVAFSSVTLEELENIKSSKNKSEDVRYNARKATKWISENMDKCQIIIYTSEAEPMRGSLVDSPDVKILCCAMQYGNDGYDFIFVTNDILCGLLAKAYFHMEVQSIQDNGEIYRGYKTVSLDENQMAYFYEHLSENQFDLLINQYLLIQNENGEIVDKYRWDGTGHKAIKIPNMKSSLFGAVKPYNGDIYQQIALDSLNTNQVTMIKGKAGTGKSYLAIGYMLWMLEKHKIDKIVIFANPTPTVNAAKLGFLPGSQLEKLCDSSIGNMLTGKLGDKYMIEQLVAENKLSILPMCDIRGFDTSNMNCAVYITEAQNLDISLMKLALQRIGEDSICIIEGDYDAQVDLVSYGGLNNGMRRMSEVFRGQDFYGEVELKNIYRSRIANIAEQM